MLLIKESVLSLKKTQKTQPRFSYFQICTYFLTISVYDCYDIGSSSQVLCGNEVQMNTYFFIF